MYEIRSFVRIFLSFINVLFRFDTLMKNLFPTHSAPKHKNASRYVPVNTVTSQERLSFFDRRGCRE